MYMYSFGLVEESQITMTDGGRGGCDGCTCYDLAERSYATEKLIVKGLYFLCNPNTRAKIITDIYYFILAERDLEFRYLLRMCAVVCFYYLVYYYISNT